MLDYDHNAGEVDTRSAEAVLAAAAQAGTRIEWALDARARRPSLGCPFVKAKTGAKIGIGEHITDVQRLFRPIFNAEDLKTDGSDFDHLFKDGERFKIGALDVEVLYTPGHTGRHLLQGRGRGLRGRHALHAGLRHRANDFPGGDAHKLYRSIRRLLALPPETRLFMCHDYKAPGRDTYAWETTVGEERANNVHVKEGVTEDEFVAMREARDAELSAPRLLLPSIQVNIRAGRFPPAEANGVRYLTIPVKLKGGAGAAV